MNNEQSDSPNDPDAATQTSQPRVFPLAALWALVVAVAGGYACGWAIRMFYVLGNASLLVLGVLAGYVAKRLFHRQSRLAGVMLAAACLLAGTFAMTIWIYHNEREGLESWWESLQWLPAFLKQNVEFAVGAATCTAIGAWAAFRQVARRPTSAASRS